MKFPQGKYWWLVSNPDTYKWDLINEPVETEFCIQSLNENGKHRASAGAFNKIAAGDWVLGYICGKRLEHGVYALLKCTRALTNERFDGTDYGWHCRFKKVCNLDPYIPWKVFAENPILKKSHMVTLHNSGTLFSFNDAQQRELLKVLTGSRGGQKTISSSSRSSIHIPKVRKEQLALITRTERLRETLQREGQKELRNYLLGEKGRCAVTGLSVHSLLVVSHIKDWKKCRHDERLDEANVLLLAKNVDAAFDRKLISFDSEGRIIKSDMITWKELSLLGISKSARIPRPQGKQVNYLAWHRARLQRACK